MLINNFPLPITLPSSHFPALYITANMPLPKRKAGIA
jgi:hypothetical protein